VPRLPLDDGPHPLVGGAVVERLGQVVAAAGGAEVDRQPDVDDEALALDPLLRVDAVVGVEAETFQENLVERLIGARGFGGRGGAPWSLPGSGSAGSAIAVSQAARRKASYLGASSV